MAGTDCIEWEGIHSDGGYGRYGVEYAHRRAYESVHGPIPEGCHVHHTCKNHGCVNPDHLEAHLPGDHPDAAPAINRAKTHCKYGHPYDEQNTRRRPDGSRACLTCSRIRVAHYKRTGSTKGALV